MLNNRVGEAISNLDQALGNVLEVRSSIGARLNAIDSQEYVNDNNLLQTKEVLSSLEDLDYAEAITRLNIQMAGLEAAQKAYTKIQGLSVFNYI
jgi:flagellar hook-associated protein 3 FlgL